MWKNKRRKTLSTPKSKNARSSILVSVFAEQSKSWLKKFSGQLDDWSECIETNLGIISTSSYIVSSWISILPNRCSIAARARCLNLKSACMTNTVWELGIQKNLINQGGETSSSFLQQLKLSSTSPEQMSIEDLSKLAIYAYHTHPEVFQLVLIQPGMIELLSNSLLTALLGILASCWLSEPDRWISRLH